MTTLIDKIMKRIDELKKSTCTKSIVDELERVKAELTAVKGVDELVEKRETKSMLGFAYNTHLIGKFISDLKSLKQTPVASECKHCRDFNGDGTKTCTDCLKNVPVENLIIEERLKDSQPKEMDDEEGDTMDIHSQIGDRVIVTEKTALSGMDNDKDKVKSKLKIGEIYTIKRIEINERVTYVWLNEVDGIFNSVNFQNYSG